MLPARCSGSGDVFGRRLRYCCLSGGVASDDARTARFWAYLGDRDHPYEVYDFTESRQRAGPQNFLAGFEGCLQADAYGGCDGVCLESGGAIVEVACQAHTRRYWYTARDLDPTRAHHVLAVIGQLYKVERAAEDADAQARQSLRAEHSAPLLADLKAWLDDQEFLPKSVIGQAATYTRNQWDVLNRYVEDGDLSIDNNAAERSMKPVAIGRKNWRAPDVPSRTSGRSPPRDALLAMFVLNRGRLVGHLYPGSELAERVRRSAKQLS